MRFPRNGGGARMTPTFGRRDSAFWGDEEH